MYARVIVFILLMFLASCEWMSQMTRVGDGSIATTNQTQDKASGAKVDAQTVEEITTINEQGIDMSMLLAILGGTAFFSLTLGMIIPQPRFIKLFW